MRLVISGDKSRYQFFRSIVELEKTGSQEIFFTERLGEKEIFLTSDLNKIDDNVFYSSRLPLNTDLFFPPEYADLVDLCENEDKVVLFDEFPYATDDDIERLHNMIQTGKVNQVSVVLFKSQRNALDSDISTEKMALEEAEIQYRKRNISVYRYSTEEIPYFLIWESNVSDTMLHEAYRAKLEMAKFNLEIFDSTYELMFDNLDEQEQSIATLVDFDVLTSFCSYDNRIKGKDVWKTYYNRSFKFYWRNDYLIKKFCRMMYKSAIEDICLWDFEEDFSKLYECIKKEYAEEFTGFKPLIFNGEKSMYDDFVNTNQEEILAFKLCIQNYFRNEIKEIIKARIQRNIVRMEALIE